MIPEQPPKRIYLQPPDTDTDDDDLATGFCLDGATWCEDRINDCDVEYIRADLAAPAEPEPLPPHLLPFTDQTCWQQRDDLVREVLGLLEKIKALEASIRQVAEARDIHFRKVQELEAAARRPTPSLAAAPEVDPETCTHQNTELVCLDCCPSPATHNPDQSWSADREAGPVGINQDLWRSLYDLCRIVRSTPRESICSALTAYLAGSFDDFGLKVNLAFKTSASPSEGKEKGR